MMACGDSEPVRCGNCSMDGLSDGVEVDGGGDCSVYLDLTCVDT